MPTPQRTMVEAASLHPVRIAWMVPLELLRTGLRSLLGSVPGAACVLGATHGSELLTALQQGVQVDVVIVLVLPGDHGEMELLRTLRTRYPELRLVAVPHEPVMELFDAAYDNGATLVIPAIDLTEDRLHRLVEATRAELLARQ